MLICANVRRLLIHQLLRTMAMEFCEDDYGFIGVDDGQWTICLPDDDTALVVIAFRQDADPGYAADKSMRFCKLLDLIGLNMVVAASFFEADSTGTTTVETMH
jgi:hypothetical protein